MNTKGFSDKYGGVELTFFPPDPWSGLYNLEHAVSGITSGTGDVSKAIAKKVSHTFIQSAQEYYHKANIKTQTGAMYSGYFCNLRNNGDIIFGNKAISQSSGEPYATHIEYGFYNVKTGRKIPPKPTMRPAVQDAMVTYVESTKIALRDAFMQRTNGLSQMIATSLDGKSTRTPSRYYRTIRTSSPELGFTKDIPRYYRRQTSAGYVGRTTFKDRYIFY